MRYMKEFNYDKDVKISYRYSQLKIFNVLTHGITVN